MICFLVKKTFSPRRTRGFPVRLDFMDEITEDSPLVLKDLRIRGLGGLDLNPQARLGDGAMSCWYSRHLTVRINITAIFEKNSNPLFFKVSREF